MRNYAAELYRYAVYQLRLADDRCSYIRSHFVGYFDAPDYASATYNDNRKG